MPRSLLAALLMTTGALSPAVLSAQEAGDSPTTNEAYEGSVFDGDWAAVGAGVIYGPSYDGSDDYEFTPLPIVQGSLAGISINPRPGGLALDFIPDEDGAIAFNAGIAARINGNRASRIKDEEVAKYGELETAVEVGPSVGVKFPALLNPYDSFSINVDALWDVAGAHKGRVINPSITYFTPLSKGIAVSLSASARHVDDKYADYYYSVPDVSLGGGTLPSFSAKGGFDKVGIATLVAADLDGDVTNGGLALVVLGGWSKMLGDAKDTPFTALRGRATQWMVGGGIGYTF